MLRRERFRLAPAGWQVSDKLVVPDNISLVRLPSYAPEITPIENVWAYPSGTELVHRLFDNYDDIVKACCEAWNSFIADPKPCDASRPAYGQCVRIYDAWYKRA